MEDVVEAEDAAEAGLMLVLEIDALMIDDEVDNELVVEDEELWAVLEIEPVEDIAEAELVLVLVLEIGALAVDDEVDKGLVVEL